MSSSLIAAKVEVELYCWIFMFLLSPLLGLGSRKSVSKTEGGRCPKLIAPAIHGVDAVTWNERKLVTGNGTATLPTQGSDSSPADVLFLVGSSVTPKSYLVHEILIRDPLGDPPLTPALPPQRSISKCDASLTKTGRWLAVECCHFWESTSRQTTRPADRPNQLQQVDHL